MSALPTPWILAGVSALTLIQTGCARPPAPDAQLAVLEQSLSGGANSNEAPGEAALYVTAALTAVRQNDYAGGVLALQSAQQMPRVTADQLKAVHAAMESLTSTLVERAARGDQKAQADLAAIERTRSQ